MNLRLRSIAIVAVSLALASFTPVHADPTEIKETAAGTVFGRTADKKISFYGSTPVARPSGTAQSALTDSTGGTAATTLASTVGLTTVTIPLTSLATGLSTSAIDLLTNYTPGFAFELVGFDFVTTVVGSGTSASQVFNLEIGTTNVTGGLLTTTLTSTNTIGKVPSGTAITGANVGTASDTLSIEMAAGGTVFTGGAGYFVIKLRNLDTVNAFSSLARQGNGLRSALAPTTGVGLIKGAP